MGENGKKANIVGAWYKEKRGGLNREQLEELKEHEELAQRWVDITLKSGWKHRSHMSHFVHSRRGKQKCDPEQPSIDLPAPRLLSQHALRTTETGRVRLFSKSAEEITTAEKGAHVSQTLAEMLNFCEVHEPMKNENKIQITRVVRGEGKETMLFADEYAMPY